MPSRRVGRLTGVTGVTFSAGIKHSVALSSDTSRHTPTSARLRNYKLLATRKEDLSRSDLYSDLAGLQRDVAAVKSKLNHCDGFSDLSRGRTKSECMIRRSRELQNMFVVPLNQNIPCYPSNASKPIPPSYLARTVPRMDEVYQEHNNYLLRHPESVRQYQGFRPVQSSQFRQTAWTSLGYQGELCPELREKQLEVLENRYGGRVTAHTAATVIQSAWRDYVLRTKFRRMMDIAKSTENISCKRLSLLEPELTESECELRQTSGQSPAARHINSRRMRRQNAGLKRANSLKDHRRSGSWSGFEPIERPEETPCVCGEEEEERQERRELKPSNSWTERGRPQTAADLQNVLNQSRDQSRSSPQGSPVPPCPPLRGEEFYPEQEPVYSLARDSLYCSVRRPRRLPPRPPQRTVSFLGPQPPPSRPPLTRDLVSDSSLGRVVTRQKVSPLPPPPYVPPPSVHHRDPNEPLPAPPAEAGLDRPPCDSVSSIDSGFRSSCSESTSSTENTSQPTSPCQPFPDLPEDPYSYWLGSPNILTSPESAALFYRSTVDPGQGSHCCCQSHHCSSSSSLNVYHTYQDVYERLTRHPQDQSKPKKSVRIQLPAEQTESVEDSETLRRRQYRVGLNVFNTNPKRGIEYLCKKDFVEYNPSAVAKFLLGRKGLSKKMLGEYICDLQKTFNLAVLHAFVSEMDFSGLHLDIALRQLLAEVSIPGEAQKIEKLVEVFSKRYIDCNQMFVSSFKSPDTIFILSYAMVLLNTDLHNKSIKSERRMKPEDFLRNLRGIDCGSDIDAEMLRGIYDRIKSCEFKQGSDHVTQVTKVQETIVGNKRPKLNASWRRLVCFCRVTEVSDMNKKEKKDSHQRGLFLFNDLLVVTKAEKSKKKQLHHHRFSLGLSDLKVNMFRTQHFQFGVQLQERHTARIVATFACRSYNDQQRFVADIEESIAEVEEMERARIFINESMC